MTTHSEARTPWLDEFLSREAAARYMHEILAEPQLHCRSPEAIELKRMANARREWIYLADRAAATGNAKLVRDALSRLEHLTQKQLRLMAGRAAQLTRLPCGPTCESELERWKRGKAE